MNYITVVQTGNRPVFTCGPFHKAHPSLPPAAFVVRANTKHNAKKRGRERRFLASNSGTTGKCLERGHKSCHLLNKVPPPRPKKQQKSEAFVLCKVKGICAHTHWAISSSVSLTCSSCSALIWVCLSLCVREKMS